MDQELQVLLARARATRLTPAALEEQRINFAHGNAGEGDEGTIEAVRATAQQMKSADTKKISPAA